MLTSVKGFDYGREYPRTEHVVVPDLAILAGYVSIAPDHQLEHLNVRILCKKELLQDWDCTIIDETVDELFVAARYIAEEP